MPFFSSIDILFWKLAHIMVANVVAEFFALETFRE